MTDTRSGLSALETRLAKDLTLLELPSKSWVPAREHAGQRVRDVIFVGAGMCGLAGAARLTLSGVDNIVLYDAAPKGLEGPWDTFARMKTLRSPKTLAGPCLGLPALTFRAWYEAQWGEDAFDALGKIPKGMWMDYLRWYRDVLNLPVVNETRVSDVQDAGDNLIAVTLTDAKGTRTEYCRHLVLATGRSGLGGGAVPGFLSDVDRRFWAHSADDIDFAALKDKRVIVIGAGASAMDNAATALEAGAAQLDMLIRRKEMPRVNKMTGIGSQGVVHGMRYLPDAWNYRFNDYVNSQQVPPPRSSTLRVTEHPNARTFLGCPVEDVQEAGDHIVVKTPYADFESDFVIAATGFRNDFTGRDEFSAFAPYIKTWKDGVYDPSMGKPIPFMTDAPYLGDAYEFLEKEPGSCPMLARIHCFNDAAMLSHGKLSGDIPAISAGADRLMRGIVAEMFSADVETHYQGLQAYDVPELQGDEWVDSTPTLMETAK
ncbi:dihydropyrimidine dehydrogenase subunit A [Pseudooceanicola marinus]|uniref:Dihydropyrimidine dehydrogenase subunit A n=1 Tax=Pseudooceanicola marinus TaxID=396013 RepID=A0A1X6YA65_9RHOB|nr:NAD(P)/FAD-dependent oxidoreductase [Pseudooceanicola marinus]PJE33201.1 NAD(P)/FAD-dependent oxidoreductase [Pseudooceanicola marinus]SLN13470.1 dihydropyrimidine dehydrogenase subunit A [Pseudooceanicola marinus]